MQKQIILQDRQLTYTLRQSLRARHMRLTVKRDGAVVLTKPARLPESAAVRFFLEKASWVISKVDHFKSLPPLVPILRHSRRDYVKHRESARAVATAKVAEFGALYGYPYGRISIKNQRSCWGSCSRKGNLNFNYRLLFLPERLQDYVVVHELCHLREMNHSKRFWELVAQTVPDHVARRRELRELRLLKNH